MDVPEKRRSPGQSPPPSRSSSAPPSQAFSVHSRSSLTLPSLPIPLLTLFLTRPSPHHLLPRSVLRKRKLCQAISRKRKHLRVNLHPCTTTTGAQERRKRRSRRRRSRRQRETAAAGHHVSDGELFALDVLLGNNVDDRELIPQWKQHLPRRLSCTCTLSISKQKILPHLSHPKLLDTAGEKLVPQRAPVRWLNIKLGRPVFSLPNMYMLRCGMPRKLCSMVFPSRKHLKDVRYRQCEKGGERRRKEEKERKGEDMGRNEILIRISEGGARINRSRTSKRKVGGRRNERTKRRGIAITASAKFRQNNVLGAWWMRFLKIMTQ
eukprot:758437-Hanusia_phi.AAC.2